MRSAGIIGLGKAVPEKVLTNDDLTRLVDTSDEWIVERTGISRRRVVGEGETSSTLGTAAAREALQSSGLKPEDIGLVLCATTSPDMFFPSTACLIQEALGCSNAAAFDLSAACSGFGYGLAVASQMIAGGSFDNVLLIGVDVLTRFVDWTDRGTCILFGDGAGAVVMGPAEEGRGVLGFDLGSRGSGADLLKIEGGAGRAPASEQVLQERSQFIKMDGREVFRFAVTIMGESAERALTQAGLTPADVDMFVPHQANTRIIDSATRRLGIDPEKVFVNVQEYGNTSAASIPIALHEAYHTGRIKEDDVVVTVGFGAGLTWASCVLIWTMAGVKCAARAEAACTAGGE